MENNKNKKSVKFQGDMLNFCDFIQVFVFTRNHHLKQDLNFENYLINLDKKHYLILIKFRTGNQRLPVETGRWENLPLNERKCHLCTKNDIGDEYHYLFCCCYFESERKRLLKPMFYRNHNMLKFIKLLNSNNVCTLKRLSEFTRIIMDKFTS